MSELKRTKNELIDLANEMLFLRDEINRDNLSNLFSEVSLVQFNLLKKIWPELPKSESRPESKITLQSMQDASEIRMTYISQAVEKLANAGLVAWERGESGTYITMTESGYQRFRNQQDILLEFFDRVIDLMGIDEFHGAIIAMKEMENIINAAIPE